MSQLIVLVKAMCALEGLKSRMGVEVHAGVKESLSLLAVVTVSSLVPN